MIIKIHRMSRCGDALILPNVVVAVMIEQCPSDLRPRSKRGGVNSLSPTNEVDFSAMLGL
jgi:hypothetical protein